MYTKKILSNGLTILKVPIKGARSVLVDVFVKVGSRSEQKNVNGISHFLEHLFFKGSKKFPTAAELSHALDAVGAEYNANTGKEHTQYYIKAAKKHLAFCFDVLSDMIQNPVFDKAEIEREKGVIIEEINMYEDTPMRHVEDVLEEIMWPAQPLGRNIAGTKQVIKSITRKNILDYVSAHYQPKNMIVAVSGAFSDKAVDELARHYWSKVPSKSFPKWKKAVENQKSPVIKVENKNTEQQHMAIGFRSYDYKHPDYAPQALLAAILGGGMSSRLFTEIRERRGLAYYVRAHTSQYQDTGNFVVQAGIRKNAIKQAVELTLQELSRMKSEPVPARELQKTKDYIRGTLTLSLEDSENQLAWYLEQVAFRGKVLEPETIFEKVDKVTASDIMRVAKDIFQNKKMSLAVIGQKNQEKNLKKLLKV